MRRDTSQELRCCCTPYKSHGIALKCGAQGGAGGVQGGSNSAWWSVVECGGVWCVLGCGMQGGVGRAPELGGIGCQGDLQGLHVRRCDCHDAACRDGLLGVVEDLLWQGWNHLQLYQESCNCTSSLACVCSGTGRN